MYDIGNYTYKWVSEFYSELIVVSNVKNRCTVNWLIFLVSLKTQSEECDEK